MTVEKGRCTYRMSTNSESVLLQTCSHALAHVNPAWCKGIYHSPVIQRRKQRPRDAKSPPGDTRLRAAQFVHSSVSTTLSSSSQHIIVIIFFSGLVLLRREGLPPPPPPQAFLQPLLTWGQNFVSDLIQSRWKVPLGSESVPFGNTDLQISLGMRVENKQIGGDGIWRLGEGQSLRDACEPQRAAPPQLSGPRPGFGARPPAQSLRVRDTCAPPIHKFRKHFWRPRGRQWGGSEGMVLNQTQTSALKGS